MKKIWKKSRKMIASFAIVLAIVAVGIVAYALFNKSDDDTAVNRFVPANAEIAVQENNGDNTSETSEFTNKITWTPDGTSYRADKQVKVTNPSNDDNLTDVYARVMLIPRWTSQVKTATSGDVNADYSGYTLGSMPTSISGTTYTMGVTDGSKNHTITFTLASDWNTNWIYKNGYFYCKTSLAPGESTPVLLESVSVEKDFYEEFTNTNGCNFQVNVLADSVQTEDEAAALRWNLDDIGITTGTDKTGKSILQESTETNVTE